MLYFHSVLACIVICIVLCIVLCIEYIPVCIQYEQACIQYIPVCIGMYCISIVYILDYNTSKYRLNTHHNTCHKTCQVHCESIGIHTNTYQHVLVCSKLVFAMYETMIHESTDLVHAYISIFANTDANTFTNTIPIQSSTNQYKH